MAIWYVDYVNGNDSNDGKSWATAFKRLDGVTGAKGFVTNDTIRFAKSPDPTSLGQTAQWTDLSKNVVLTTPVTKNIDLCESAWTKVAANMTPSSAAGGKQNVNCTFATTTTTANALQAYKATGALDLSAYQQVSFWVYAASAAIGASTNWTLCLCSDTAGATIVYSVPIPPIPQTNCWVPIAVDLGTPMTTTIQSVALYSGSTPQNSMTVSLDNIIACKAPSAPDALTLLSLISKNNGVDPWVSIQSINDTTIMIDNYVGVSTSSSRGYVGTTENVILYKREATRTALATSATASVQSVALPGSVTATLSGGWNPSTGLQDSETIYDGQNSQGYGLVFGIVTSIYYLENISVVRYNNGFNFSTPPMPGSTFRMYQLVNNQAAMNAGTNAVCCTVTVANVFGNNTGVAAFSNSVITVQNANSNTSPFQTFANSSMLTFSTCRNNQYGIMLNNSGGGLTIKDSQFANNSSFDIYAGNLPGNGPVFLKNVKYGSTAFGINPNEARIISHNDQQVAGATKILAVNLTIVNDSTITHTAGGMSWKMSPNGRTAAWPGWLTIGSIWCPATQQRTFSAWFRRDNTALTGGLAVRGNLVNGIPNNVLTTMSAAVNTWENLSLSVTPSEDCVLQIEAWGWTSGGYNLWVTEFAAL